MVAMPHIGAMQFFGEDLTSSYGFAQQFAGDGGHVATLPEVITARANVPMEHVLWYYYYTTSTCEYFGTTQGGNDIVIVAHGNGPASSLDGIDEIYKPRMFRSDGRSENSAGHISHQEFRRLENGDYGEVSIIDFADVRKAYESDWFSFVTLFTAERDPLLQARLGPDWRRVLEMLHDATQGKHFERGRRIPSTIKSDGPFQYWNKKYRDELPYAHLLSVGGTVHMNAEGEEFLSFDVHVHARNDGRRFIGVRPGASLTNIHAGPTILDYNRGALVLPHKLGDDPLPTFFVLKQYGDKWFTCVRKEGYSLDTGWPEFPVKEFELVGSTGKIVSPGEMFFFRYDIAEVMWQAPPEANAYYVGEPRKTKVDGDEAIEADVYFCKVTVDTTLRCVPEETLKKSFDTQMQLLERFERIRSEM
ncbi:MAG: hypothetical protein JWN38_169 [Candidatus Saccharibacteria bacterium]|nr:hypothetical protein [Candidatus Saccharibacteria bacterium]